MENPYMPKENRVPSKGREKKEKLMEIPVL